MPEHSIRKIITNSDGDVIETHSGDVVPESVEDKHKKLRDGFVWQEELEEGEADDLPSVSFALEEITHCCQEIIVCLMKEISVETLRDINMGKMYFEIPLSRDFHRLFSERFNSVWNLDSRLKMIDELRSALSDHFNEDICSKLNQRIQVVIPDARRSCSLDSVFLNDDTVIMGEDDSPFSVEISLKFGGK